MRWLEIKPVFLLSRLFRVSLAGELPGFGCCCCFVDGIERVERPVDAPFRFVVSDIFKPVGSSVPVVAGRVVSGAVSAGVNLPTSRITCLPSGQLGTVRSIRSLAGTNSDGGFPLC